MSSSMLEQAVIDAQALKEAAIKNAEKEVLDKYAGEIKEAVNALLEQEVAPIESDPMAADTVAEATPDADQNAFLADVPLKATDGTEISENDAGSEIELDLDALVKTLAEEEVTTTEAPVVDPVVDQEPVTDVEQVMYEAIEEELKNLLSEEPKPDFLDLDKDGDKEEPMKKAAKDKKEKEETNEAVDVEEAEDLDADSVSEELEIDEDIVKAAIEEILKVDMEVVPRGSNGTTHPTKAEQVHAVEVAAAADEATEVKEENAEFEKAVKKIAKLEEQVKSLKSDKNRLLAEQKELKSIAVQISEKLTEINTTNAKLVYKNRILESSSLNERQKTKLVEAVSKASSTEEAKVIFETLQDSLSSTEENAPKNLSEAVSKNSQLVLKSNKKESQVSTSAAERMKKLAGII